MKVKSDSVLGIRSSVILTVLAAVLLVVLETLKAMPQTKWVAIAVAVIGAILVLINKKNGEEVPEE
jgi:uncharacterized membrane protein YeaQ/YmgE (transglycosylase-associated protein family)